jgi:cyclic pyranopterin phosphate synthase
VLRHRSQIGHETLHGARCKEICPVDAGSSRDCTRARLSAEGRLYTCLYASQGTDLRGPLRAGASDAELEAIVAAAWRARADRYSELRSAATAAVARIEMSYIGG